MSNLPYLYVKHYQKPSSPAKKHIRTILPAVFVSLGSLILVNVFWPILSYQLTVSPQVKKSEYLSPIPNTIQQEVGSVFNPQQQIPQVLGAEFDYTNAKSWFPTATEGFTTFEASDSYLLDIPVLGIESAQVVIGGEDLDESLIHYPGTAEPGQYGSPVIFGHSVLRQFYNPSIQNKDRYISIFSKIMTLKPGDDILVSYDSITYTYQVVDKVEVDPEDIFILEQRYTNRELKLITCVPEGTYLRRGVVTAQLVDLSTTEEEN